MPEGHIAHRNAGIWREALVGLTVRGVDSRDPRVRALGIPERLTGDTVAGAEARGKHHLLRFTSGRVLHTHLRMNGFWQVVPAGAVGLRSALTLALRFDGRTAALYRCRDVRVLEPGDPLPVSVRALGPDLLSPEGDPGPDTCRALTCIDPSREIGEALMDQRVVSGIGNVYKSEALFLAGIDPWRAVGSIPADDHAKIGIIASALLQRGVRHHGAITTYDPPDRAWRPQRGENWVYRRVNQPCRRCETPIRARGQGDDNRTTYWCLNCQR